MSGRVWFVTGSSSGLGRALVEAVLASGDRVAMTAREPERLGDLANLHPDRALALPLDVTDAEQAKRAVAETVATFGRIDVLVNNAGYALLGALEELSDAQLRLNLETNLIGPLNVIRAALPTLRSQRSGHIINISAIAAFGNEWGFSIYGGSKAALEAATEALRGELAPFGIKTTVIVPGPFRTDFLGRSLVRAEASPEYLSTVGKFGELLSKINGKQPGDPALAAEAIIKVADDPSPPFRLVLGRYAVDKFRKKLKTMEAELSAWESVGLATEHGRS